MVQRNSAFPGCLNVDSATKSKWIRFAFSLHPRVAMVPASSGARLARGKERTMMRVLRSASWALAMLLATGAVHAAPAVPTQEVRVFRVNVDQKPAGEYRMTIRQEG